MSTPARLPGAPAAAALTWELSQRFYFEAAHTLRREHGVNAEIEAEASRRVHGHTYLGKVTVRGSPAPGTGMVVDLGLLRTAIDDVRARLDHRLLDEVDGLGAPTLENLCAYLYRLLAEAGWPVASVEVAREASGDSCTLRAG